MNILLTKSLSASDLDLIRSWGWHYEVVLALQITPVEAKEIPHAEAWIVSSRNSIAAAKKFKDRAPDFIYCVGSWSKVQLMNVGVKSTILSFDNMGALVAGLKGQNLKTILYFCGEAHRPELAEGLKNSDVKIHKVITHRSTMTFPHVENKFDVIFVFSPRAAESLLKHNVFSDQTTFACIGPTTASFLKDRKIASTFIPSYPDSRILLEEFHHQTVNQKF